MGKTRSSSDKSQDLEELAAFQLKRMLQAQRKKEERIRQAEQAKREEKEEALELRVYACQRPDWKLLSRMDQIRHCQECRELLHLIRRYFRDGPRPRNPHVWYPDRPCGGGSGRFFGPREEKERNDMEERSEEEQLDAFREKVQEIAGWDLDYSKLIDWIWPDSEKPPCQRLDWAEQSEQDRAANCRECAQRDDCWNPMNRHWGEPES